MKRETGPPEIFGVCFFLAIIVWKKLSVLTIRMPARMPISNSENEGAKLQKAGAETVTNHSTVTKSGCACEMPPWRFPSNLARRMTLFVQLELLTRKAAPPQLTAVRFAKELFTHSVCGASPQPRAVRVSACAMNTPK